jgi:polysaccharide pyruvyl transferase WcaK-like protein
MTDRKIVYLGWQGQGNFGDDLLHATWSAALDDPLDVLAPLERRDYGRRFGTFLRHRARVAGTERIVLLGGGTTVGFRSWSQHAALAHRAFGARAVVGTGLGAAIASDTYSTHHQPQDWAAWRALRDFRLLGVRGPATEREVGEHLAPTRVIGDPALLYPRLRPVQPANGPRRIGVALGSDPRSRFDLDTVATAVRDHAEASGAAQVVAFALSSADRTTAHEFAARVGVEARVHEYVPGDVHATMEELAGCSTVVSERLHGVVPAVALGLPTVPLSYASKCDDFWMSVTGTTCPIGVDSDTSDLAAALRHAEQTVPVAQRVDELQTVLADVSAGLRAWLRGTADLDQATLGPSPTPSGEGASA